MPDPTDRLHVTVGSTALPPSPSVSGRSVTVNIASALQAWLAAQPSTPELVQVPLRVTAAGAGTITVYPPDVAYDI